MMNDSRAEEQAAGLCARCLHAQIIRSDRGSRFYLCRLSAVDPRYPKYPRLPVIQCAGHVPVADTPRNE
jgi:hypothetical protein